MARIPTQQDVLDWIAENPAKGSKRDIAKAFGIKGADRIELKRLLREMADDGLLKKRRKSYRDPQTLAPVSVLLVTGTDNDGDILARPLEWQGDGQEPVVQMVARTSDPALAEGDRILARVNLVDGADRTYEGRLIRRIGHLPRNILGIFRASSEGGRVQPIDRKSDREWLVAAGATYGAKDGELVEAEQAGPKTRLGLPCARITNRLGDPAAPKAVSLIAIHQHGIPDVFPDAALSEAAAATEVALTGRTDMRNIPFVTIDPTDARDRDDAVWAGPDPDGNGGHIVRIAIADVAHFVRPGSALDREARLRGNSTYFADRVVPMLPDRLSGDLCSLHEEVDRAVLTVTMKFDAEGNRTEAKFARAVIRSRASLAYETAQAVVDGDAGLVDEEVAGVLLALFSAWATTIKARSSRGPLDLDLPERRIEISDAGVVTRVFTKERLDAHRLIEEFMVAANVAAADVLIKKQQPLLFRVHEEPDPDKLETLRTIADASGFNLAKGQVVSAKVINRLLEQSRETDHSDLISMAVLRSMQQAFYHPQNLGHFGLALPAYAHFTSPIRRYADLIVHRALIAAHGWGDDGLTEEETEGLDAVSVQISQTERRSMQAERDTADRYLAAYLADRVGSEQSGRISGVTRFGLFVRLDETGADGLVPGRGIGHEYFVFDAASQSLMGEHSGLTLGLAQRVLVRISDAVPVTGGLIFELLEVDGKPLPKAGPSRRKKGRITRSKSRSKAPRKVTRKRRAR